MDWNARDQYKGHRHYEYTADWVERYDQTSIQTQYDTAPLEFFKPYVFRVFTRPSKGIEIYLGQ